MRDSDVSSTEPLSLIVPVDVGSGRFRLHLTGPRFGLRAVLEELSHYLDGREAAARGTIAGLVPEHVARLLIDPVPQDR